MERENLTIAEIKNLLARSRECLAQSEERKTQAEVYKQRAIKLDQDMEELKHQEKIKKENT